MTYQYVCALDDLPENGTQEAFCVAGDLELDIFLIRRREMVRAYVNRCPHTGSPLNWMPNAFLDEARMRIVCSTHGARFRIDDGYCVFGPCTGQKLSELATFVRGKSVFVEFPLRSMRG